MGSESIDDRVCDNQSLNLASDVEKAADGVCNSDYWKSLNEAQKKALICRETIYQSNFSILEKAISGSDFGNYLHFVFESPEEGLGALASLKYFEDKNGVVLNIRHIPKQVIDEINPTLDLPKEEERKRGIVAYLHTKKDKI